MNPGACLQEHISNDLSQLYVTYMVDDIYTHKHFAQLSMIHSCPYIYLPLIELRASGHRIIAEPNCP